MKYDGSLVLPFEKMEALRRRLGLEDDGKAPPIWVAGSTHPGEEEPILEAYREASVRCPRLRLAIVPRHPERFDSVAELIGERGFRYVRLSQAGCNDNEWEVVLGDTLGDLQALYGLAAIIFVGGSLVPVGGHNIMEAAAWGKPVLFGLHMHNFADAAARMRERGCGVQVSDARDLAGRVTEWLGSPDRLDALGKEALNVVQENRGAVDRALELMGPWLPEPGKGVARS
jgi:3-deoxy-D-manno-octulosonic-acid transferase